MHVTLLQRLCCITVAITTLASHVRAQRLSCGTRLASPASVSTFEARLADALSGSDASKQTGTVLHIPVVVHVLYTAPAQDIPDATIVQYIADLNAAFRKTRTPVFTPRPIFDSLWTDTEIQFCLADKDSSGASTSGITHKQTSAVFGQFSEEDVKHSATGGADAWPVGSYLNIWFAPIIGSIYGVAANNNIFSGSGWNPTVEGLIINSRFPQFIPNVLAHEAGHFVGLRHTFENWNEAVDDTPHEGTTGGGNFLSRDSATCALGDLDSNTAIVEAPYWGTKNPPDMIENFMGYNRPCQFMFTKGQKARARAMLAQHYAGLIRPSCAALSVSRAASAEQMGSVRVWYSDGRSQARWTGKRPAAYALIDGRGLVIRQGTMLPDDAISFTDIPTGVYLLRAGASAERMIVLPQQ